MESWVKNFARGPMGPVLLLCMLALAVYPVLWSQAPLRYPDSGALIEVLDDIRDGSLDEMHDRTVGVPLILLVFGLGRGFFFFSLVTYLAVTVCLAWVMLRMNIAPLLVWAAAALMLMPHHIQVTGTLMTEGTTVVVLVASIVSLLAYLQGGSGKLVWVSAVLFGLCAYVRPTYQLLGLLVGGLLYLYRGNGERYRRAAAIVAVASVVLVGAYIGHNRMRLGWAALTNGMGYHLGTRTTPVYERIADPELREIVVRNRNQIAVTSGHITQTWYAVRKELMQKGMDRQEIARLAQRENVRLIMLSPLTYLQKVCEAFGFYLQPFMTPLLARLGPAQYGFAALTIVLEAAFLLLQVVLWGGFLMSRYLGRDELKIHLPFAWVLTTAVIFYTMLISCAVDWGEPRYRVVTDPLIVFVTTYSIAVLGRFRQQFGAQAAAQAVRKEEDKAYQVATAREASAPVHEPHPPKKHHPKRNPKHHRPATAGA